MNWRAWTFEVKKLHPLTISRGTSTGSTNIAVAYASGGLVGYGESAPGGRIADDFAAGSIKQLEEFLPFAPENPFDLYSLSRSVGLPLPVVAALDCALWDWIAKKANMPLHAVLGLPKPTVPTSVTVGINPPAVVRERVPELLARTKAKALKLKLGGEGGIEADKERFRAARDSSAKDTRIRVDANGGWSVADAKKMITWLAENGCDYVEQPLLEGEEEAMAELMRIREIPLFLDESCHFSTDVPRLAGLCDGVNLKLMKCGGITEALRLVATARAHGLSTMIGCMGESGIAISAGASIGALFDHIDLDSNLNLNPDPAPGAALVDGVVLPPDKPGHGAEWADA